MPQPPSRARLNSNARAPHGPIARPCKTCEAPAGWPCRKLTYDSDGRSYVQRVMKSLHKDR